MKGKFIRTEHVYSNDLRYYYNELRKIVKKSGLNITTLGKVSNEKIYLINNNNEKGILIASGFHGNESAGPWSILKYLKETKNIGNVSFIPIVNPTGFKVCKRYNMYGEDPNRGFTDAEECKTKLSREGKILFKNINLLNESSKLGILTLHEDCDKDDCFVYCYKNKKVARRVKKSLLKYFNQLKDGSIDPSLTDAISVDGIIKDCHDGSLEDYFSDKIAQCITSETPGRKNIQDRIDAGVEAIKTFIFEINKLQGGI